MHQVVTDNNFYTDKKLVRRRLKFHASFTGESAEQSPMAEPDHPSHRPSRHLLRHLLKGTFCEQDCDPKRG